MHIMHGHTVRSVFCFPFSVSFIFFSFFFWSFYRIIGGGGGGGVVEILIYVSPKIT